MESLIDSPVMQRLRRVGQLGTAHLVYPGAHHKRFEHSLGASHLAGRLAQAMGLDEGERRTARAAALLHDVGHGPFSHAFEELVKERGRSHEDATVDQIQWGPLADLLRQGGLDPVAVAEAVQGQGALGPIVSGSLDADRMDYLLRDAHYTGVRVGADPDRLVGVVRRDPGRALVLRESGLVAAEAFLTTRYLMYPAVYLHHTVRASETMLQTAIRDLVGDASDQQLLAELERETDDGLLWRLRQHGGIAAGLVGRLDARRLYKRAFEGRADRFEEPEVQRLVSDPAHRLQTAAEIADAAGVPPHHVILDAPHSPRFRELGLPVRTRDGRTIPLGDASALVAALHAARMDHWRFWAFCPARDVAAVTAAAQRVLG